MNNKIKFTFIIPNYNKGIYIEECLNSIYNQTYKNFEVIAIDDGSDDNSLDKLKKFPLDKLLTTNRLQAGGARNAGFKYATGDYVVFLDSDDYLTNNTVLEKLADTIKDEDLIFMNFTINRFGEIEEIIEPITTIEEKIQNTNLLGCPTKCFKRELINDIYFPEGKRYEDILFTTEALCKAKTYTYFEDSFFMYRLLRNSNTTSPILESAQLDMLEELVKIYRLCVKYPKYKKELLNRIKKARLPLRMELLDCLIETGENKYHDYF